MIETKDEPWSPPFSGTEMPEGRPFWFVDGEAYDFTDWIHKHPGGALWFSFTQGRDISTLFHTYHKDPQRVRRMLSKYHIADVSFEDILPKMGLPPFLLADHPDFDARYDLPQFDFDKGNTLLARIRQNVAQNFPGKSIKKYDRAFDTVTVGIGILHILTLGGLVLNLLPAWLCVIVMVLTNTSLAGAGHYYLHRKKYNEDGMLPFGVNFGQSLFDLSYVGTSLIGADGHVMLHHPYLTSEADVKRPFLNGMLRLHPWLRIPGYTLQKLFICLFGMQVRGFEVNFYERDNTAVRRDFWFMRGLILFQFLACLISGHFVAWFIQFALTLWFNTFLVASSHDPEEDEEPSVEELTTLPEHLRNDWAAQQIGLTYDLSIVGNRWVDVFLSAGLSPHRVHHALPYQASGFANLASEKPVREACEEMGLAWERPQNFFTERLPVVVRHYLVSPQRIAPDGNSSEYSRSLTFSEQAKKLVNFVGRGFTGVN